MRNLIFTLLLLTVSCKSITSQESINGMENAISELSWNSFNIVINYSTKIEFSDGVNKIIDNGKSSTKQLISALSDNEKTVSAHLILTKLWDPMVFELKVCEQFELDSESYISYTLNNLSWLHNSVKDKHSLDDKEKNKIISYWNNRTIGNGTD